MDQLIQQFQECSFETDYTKFLEPTLDHQGLRTTQRIPQDTLLGPIHGSFQPIHLIQHPQFIYLDNDLVLDYSEQTAIYGERAPLTYITENNQTWLPSNCRLAINELGKVYVKTTQAIEPETELVYDMFQTEYFYAPFAN